jgi:hypothetical protein
MAPRNSKTAAIKTADHSFRVLEPTDVPKAAESQGKRQHTAKRCQQKVVSAATAGGQLEKAAHQAVRLAY